MADDTAQAGVRKQASFKAFLLYIILPLTLKLKFSALLYQMIFLADLDEAVIIVISST